jgi:hypothetical protein
MDINLLNEMISVFWDYSKWGEFILNTSVGLFALWQGIYIMATRNLDRLEAFTRDKIEKSYWYKIKSLDGIVLVFIITSFFIGSVLNYYHIRHH